MLAAWFPWMKVVGIWINFALWKHMLGYFSISLFLHCLKKILVVAGEMIFSRC